jgi:hypothetical protein
MQNICLEHRKSHGLIYQFNMPWPHSDGSGYVRTLAKLHASPLVTWQDILEEFHSKKDDDFLKTVTIIHHFFVISLTVAGFRDIAFRTPQRADLPYPSNEELFKRTAQSLIAERDFEAAGGYERKDHKFPQYWPKD